jgi:hypothetical protein
MISRAFHTPLPSIAPFEHTAAMLQAPQPQFGPMSFKEETQAELLAMEIVRYAPQLAEILEQDGLRKLRKELA